MTGATPRVLPVGDAALCVEFGDALDLGLNARVRALDRALQEEPLRGQLETVPTLRSLLVIYDARRAGFAAVREDVRERCARLRGGAAGAGPLRVVPTRYGGEDGPDLPRIADQLGLAQAELVRRHVAGDYTALMLGFRPGFAYLGLLPEPLATPRLATPRLRVPAGSVAVAGRQTGIYPEAAPGGWNLIGRTSLRLFDPGADPPALLAPGDRVRFVASEERDEAPPRPLTAPAAAAPALEVLDGGLLTTIQDAGRHGLRRLGVGWAGALDLDAYRAANALLGNAPGAAVLECTLAGPRLRFLVTTHFALTGADLGALLHREDLGAWPVPLGRRVLARPGNQLSFSGRSSGCRSYLAFAGGLSLPSVLGSRATDLGSSFGGLAGRALQAGDRLALVPQAPGPPTLAEWRDSPLADPLRVRVVLGPQHEHLEPAALARFLSEPYAVRAESDRGGCRLAGPPLSHRGTPEILSDGMMPGSIQIPPDGQPILMLADGPTTGGYPKVATVVTADLPRLAQLVPGASSLRFESIAVEDAQRL